jgi:rhamnosyltransferase
MNIDVVVRCRNEMPHCQRALDALSKQRGIRGRVLFYDCESTDGSREVARRSGVELIDVEPSTYMPGVVLNRGMDATSAQLVAFINADVVALDEDSLVRLAEPLRDARVAASFGRQLPRADADACAKADTERAFGATRPGRVRSGVFFSMAASMVRRDWWSKGRFDERIRYSEDVEWTRRMTLLGASIEYVPRARFEHSHNYDWRAHFRRRRGEGAADSVIFDLGAARVAREGLVPLASSLLRDARAGRLSVDLAAKRAMQAAGYVWGRAKGFAP